MFTEVYFILEMPNKERRKRVKDTELKIAAKNCKSITKCVRWAWFMILWQHTKSSDRSLNAYCTPLPRNLSLFIVTIIWLCCKKTCRNRINYFVPCFTIWHFFPWMWFSMVDKVIFCGFFRSAKMPKVENNE